MKTKNTSANRSPAFTGIIRDAMGRFKSGCSGNPAGKPRGTISVAARIKAELKKVPPGQRMSWADALVQLIVKRAMEGDPRIIDLILRNAGSEFRRGLKEAVAEKADLMAKKPGKIGASGGSGKQLT